MLHEDIRNRRLTYSMTEVAQPLSNARVAPPWLSPRHLKNQVAHLMRNFRSPYPTPVEGPFQGDQAAVPHQDRVRCDNAGDGLQHFSPECLPLHCRPSPLFICQSWPLLLQLALENLALRLQMLDDRLRVPIQPAKIPSKR